MPAYISVCSLLILKTDLRNAAEFTMHGVVPHYAYSLE